MSEERIVTPQDEADRIRLKRLARLGGPNTTSPSPGPPSEPSRIATPEPPKPKLRVVAPAPLPVSQPGPSTPKPAVKKAPAGPVKINFSSWEDETVGRIFNVTLDREYAQMTRWETVWLKHLEEELLSEDTGLSKPIRMTADMVDRILISRLELDPQGMSDDLDYVNVLASLPHSQTTFEYLAGCWKRHNSVRAALTKKTYASQDLQRANEILDKVKDLIISYIGLTLQEPEMFTQPQDRVIGPPELVNCLISLSSLTNPLSNASTYYALAPTDVPQFLQDLTQRFAEDDDFAIVLGPVIVELLRHESLTRSEGLGGADSGWRGVVGGMEALVSIKPIAALITKLPQWNPPEATAADIENISLMGPLLRLGVFYREWPSIGATYFSEPEKKTRADVESSNASLRGTMKSLQSALFQIFNGIVRASPEAREAVLQYFSRVVSLNVKRGGMQVDPDTVASDSFMVNVQTVLLRFAEPFMDAKYSKMDKIDPLYLAHSIRVDVKDETRLKATSEEVAEWLKNVQESGKATPPNFISEIFYLTAAINHYGLNRTLQSFEDLHKSTDDIQRHLDYLTASVANISPSDPLFMRSQAVIAQTKGELSKIHTEQFAYQVQLLDPEFVFRQIGFTNFVETWLVRLVDPKGTHPNPIIDVPLPKETPEAFKMLPEYFMDDIVDFLLFLLRNNPASFDLSGRTEMVIWAITFLRSTWYIKNPFLKAKINEVLFYGILGYGRERNGVIGGILNTHPFALKHLMPALMSFYIEVEQTGASSQFYDKFNARRNIAYILKAIWDNPTHREALNIEAKDVDKFVRFVNLMINDVTYLMDESLSELTQISQIQHEMDDPAWQTQSQQHRREREGTLRQLERHASGYTTLGRSTVDLLKIFTAETKAPFMMPEIVIRLAAMLDYNLDALVGPRCQDLKVKDREKYRFEPRKLLSDILQVYLNLSDEEEFVRAVASDGRSYRKELFERAAVIARNRSLKTEDEIQKLREFVDRVEAMKLTLEAEEDLGEIPDEFLDPLMATLMRDPVTLPSSNVVIDRSTIKSHLLSDTKDPFNRSPLSIEDVITNSELKARIDAFVAERRGNAMAVDPPVNPSPPPPAFSGNESTMDETQ